MSTNLIMALNPRRQMFWLALTGFVLFVLGAILLPNAIAKTRNEIFALLTVHRIASATMLSVIVFSVWVAWRTRWLDWIGRLTSGQLYLLAISPIIIPLMTNRLSFAFNGPYRPSWQLWFLRDATPYLEGSLVATVLLFAWLSVVIVHNELWKGAAKFITKNQNTFISTIGVAAGFAPWVYIVSIQGKHPLAALAAIVIGGYFWIRHNAPSISRKSVLYSILIIGAGYCIGMLWPVVWRVLSSSLGILVLAAGIGVLFELWSRDSEETSGYRLGTVGASVGGLGCALGLALSAVIGTAWFDLERCFEIFLGIAEIPDRWEENLIQAGILGGDRFSLGYSAAQARMTLFDSTWNGSSHTVTLPHAWDDYMLLTLLERFGWSIGLATILLLSIFLWLTYTGIKKNHNDFIGTFGLMLWGYLALSCVINCQANLGLLPGAPFLGLPFLSYNWFLAALGGLVMGLALRGLDEADRQQTPY